MNGDRSCDVLAILQSRITVLEARIALHPADEEYLRGQLFGTQTALEDVRADLARSIFGSKELLSA